MKVQGSDATETQDSSRSSVDKRIISRYLAAIESTIYALCVHNQSAENRL